MKNTIFYKFENDIKGFYFLLYFQGCKSFTMTAQNVRDTVTTVTSSFSYVWDFDVSENKWSRNRDKVVLPQNCI